jgi:hypothetical protein
MQRRIFCLINSLFVLAVSAFSEVGAAPASSVEVQEFVQTDRTINILHAVANRYHVVIGVSGTIVGSDKQAINVSIKKGKLGDVFDTIQSQDLRFVWNETT